MSHLSTWQQVFCPQPTLVQRLSDYKGVEISVKRDDLNHPMIQGNKLRKLKYNIKFALDNNYRQLATFGGAWSNHLLATAKAANLLGLSSIGFVRGDELENNQSKWSDTLIQAKNYNMQFVFMSRLDYREKQSVKVVQHYLSQDTYLIPEGGSNDLALQGVVEIINELNHQIQPPTHIITACGTAGTMAGLIDGIYQVKWKSKVLGIPVLKGAGFLNSNINDLSKHYKQVNWQLYLDYHAGGYAKTNITLLDFAKQFKLDNKISLDKIYTIKSFFAAYDLIDRGEIPANSKIVILHTGGLQGGVV